VRADSLKEKDKIREREVGAFFTGGVDSFYTFLKHKDEIDCLVYVHGYDMGLDKKLLLEQVSRKIREIANSFNKTVIEVKTDLRQFSNQFVSWGFYHGAALATVGHLLKHRVEKIYIPSSYTYDRLFLWGSHPLLDPLWSSNSIKFVHDGCEATRVDKTFHISNHDIALNSLRVCFKNIRGAYNCGRCEKCIRTMLNLKAIGSLDRCTTFESPLRIRNILRIQSEGEGTRAFIRENLKALRTRNDSEKIRWALKWVLLRLLSLEKIRRSLIEIRKQIGLRTRLRNLYRRMTK